MTARRLAATLIASIWLLPVALGAGVALHLALDHGHGHGSSAALAELLEHGHGHGEAGESVESGAEHDHLVTPASSLAARTARVVVSPPPSPSLAAHADLAPRAASSFRGGPPWARPPKLAGPPLLALLSTLRV